MRIYRRISLPNETSRQPIGLGVITRSGESWGNLQLRQGAGKRVDVVTLTQVRGLDNVRGILSVRLRTILVEGVVRVGVVDFGLLG